MIDITDLSTRWGQIFGGMNEVNTFRGVTFPDRADDISALYPGFATQREVTNGLYEQVNAVNLTLGNTLQYFINLSRNTLLQMELDDSNPPANTLDQTVLTKLVNDMVAQSQTYQRPTLTIGGASSIAATPFTTLTGAPYGNGTIIGTVLAPETGLLNYYSYGEIINAVCVADSYNNGVIAGQEVFNISTPRSVDYTAYNWPQGSGVNFQATSLPTSNSTIYANAYFSDWDATNVNLIEDWTTANLNPGTTILRSTDAYTGDYAVNLVGAPINSELYQTLNGLKGATNYIAAIRYKRLNTINTGTLVVAIRDTSGNVVNDAAGNPLSLTINLAGSAGSYILGWAVFPIPRGYPEGARISIKLTAALGVGESVLLATSELCEMTQLYIGGPYVGFLPGSIGWANNDTYTMTVATTASDTTFIRNIDRIYQARNLNIMVPTASSPTQSDSLIS